LVCALLLYHAKTKSKNYFCRAKQIRNLVLANREARHSAPSGNDFPLKKHWAAQSAAREKIGKFPESQIIAGV